MTLFQVGSFIIFCDYVDLIFYAQKKWSANLGGRELHLDATDWKFRDQSPLTRCHGDSKVGINSQPRKKYPTKSTNSTNSLWATDGAPSTMGSRTLKCANIFTPRTLNRCPSVRWFSKCADFITPGTGWCQQDELRWGRGLLSVQIYSHLERQIIVRQQDGFPSMQSLSHLGQDNASRTSCDGVADS